jgi:plastocyanin
MTNSVKAILAVVLVVVIGGSIYLIAAPKNKNSTASPTTSSNQSTTSDTAKTQNPQSTIPSTTPVAAGTITYNGSSFSPSTLTIKTGDTVKITNASSSPLTFNSDPHPTHTDEPELNVGAVETGQSKTFTVTKTGSWGYHNHNDPSQRGTIVVQ